MLLFHQMIDEDTTGKSTDLPSEVNLASASQSDGLRPEETSSSPVQDQEKVGKLIQSTCHTEYLHKCSISFV